jgi:hypothetical protein
MNDRERVESLVDGIRLFEGLDAELTHALREGSP